MASPQWLKTVVGGAYSILPAQVRFGSRYQEFRSLFSSFSDSSQYTEQSLRSTIVSAIQGVPAYAGYRDLLEMAAREPKKALAELPFLDKEAVKLNLQRFVNEGYSGRYRLKMFTGGSTSVPMTFFGHVGVSRPKELAAFDAMAQAFGTDGSGMVLALRGRSVPGEKSGRLWMIEPIKRQLILSSDHLEPRFMDEYVRALRKWRPQYIHAFPSALYPLVLWLKEKNLEEVLAQVRCVTLVSESVFDFHFRAFKEFFSCPVIATYGHTERVLLANTLPNDERYHFWARYGYFELIDERGKGIDTPGQVGEIVGTSFDNLVMPFIRYRTGDFAVLSEKPAAGMCGCPVVDRIEGRLQEFVVCNDSRLITVTTIGAAHVEELERCFRIQYEQHAPGELILRVVPMQPLGEAAKLRVADAIRRKTQNGCRVTVEEVDSIELTGRGKQRLLVQHLDIRKYLGAAISLLS